MINISDFPMGATVSFELHPAQLLGPRYSHVKVVGIMDWRTASVWIDAAAMHANVRPTLPPETPNDFRQYWYLKLELSDGQNTCVGLPWIKDGTLVIHDNRTMVFTLNNVAPDDQERVRLVLAAAGFSIRDVRILDTPVGT